MVMCVTTHKALNTHRFLQTHTVYTQGDFGCRTADGEGTALVQSALSLWQQAWASQHLGRPGPPDANLIPPYHTQPGAWAVNPTIGAFQPVA